MKFTTSSTSTYLQKLLNSINFGILLQSVCLLYIGFSFVKLINYYYGLHILNNYFLLCLCFIFINLVFSYVFPTLFFKITDFFLFLLFNSITLFYLKFISTILINIVEHSYKFFLLIVNGYLCFSLLYLLNIVWFYFGLSNNFTLEFYYLFYFIRTFFFLPITAYFVLVSSSNFQTWIHDYKIRNPNVLHMEEVGLQIGRIVRRIGSNVVQNMEQHPKATTNGVLIAAGAAGIASAADAYAGSENSRMAQTQDFVNGELSSSKNGPLNPELTETMRQFKHNLMQGQHDCNNGLNCIYNSAKAVIQGELPPSGKVLEAGKDVITALHDHKSIANSIKELSIIDLF